MIISGIISAILGMILTVIGIVRNANEDLVYEYYWQYGPTASPGKTFLIIGIMLFALGIAIFVLNFVAKKKKS